jgi:hypothetical protein
LLFSRLPLALAVAAALLPGCDAAAPTPPGPGPGPGPGPTPDPAVRVSFIQLAAAGDSAVVGQAGGAAPRVSLDGAFIIPGAGQWSHRSIRFEEPVVGAPYVIALETCDGGRRAFEFLVWPNPHLEFPDPVVAAPLRERPTEKGRECELRVFTIQGLGDPPTGALRITFDRDSTRSYVFRLDEHVAEGSPSVVVRGDALTWDAVRGGDLRANVMLADTVAYLPLAVVRTVGFLDWEPQPGRRHYLGRPRDAAEAGRARYYLYLLDPSTWE